MRNLSSLETSMFVNNQFIFQLFIQNASVHVQSQHRQPLAVMRMLSIWNNKNIIIIQNKSILNELLFLLGVVKIRDLISETGNFFQGLKILQANLSPVQHFKWMSIVDVIPLDWRLLIKQNQQHSIPQALNDTVFVKVDGKEGDILNNFLKLLYEEFKSKSKPLQLSKRNCKINIPNKRWNGQRSIPCHLLSRQRQSNGNFNRSF